MKHKQALSALLALAMTWTTLTVGVAADAETVQGTPDTTPPVLNSVSIDKTEVTAPGTVTVTLDVEDEAGVSYSSLEFVNADGTIEIYEDANFDGESGLLTITVTVDKYKPSGTYYLNYLMIEDEAENSEVYRSVNSEYFDPEYNTPLPNELSFVITDSEAPDTTPPVLNSVSIDKTEVTAPGTVTVTLDVEDEAGVSYSSLEFVNADGTIEIYEDANFDGESGLLTITVTVDKYKPSGTYYLNYLMIEDEAENGEVYHSVNSEYFDPEYNTLLPNEISFSVINADYVEEDDTEKDDPFEGGQVTEPPKDDLSTNNPEPVTPSDDARDEAEEDLHISSGEMEQLIEDAKDSITIPVKEGSSINTKALKKAMEQGVEVVLNGNGFSWTFDPETTDFSKFSKIFKPFIDTNPGISTILKKELKNLGINDYQSFKTEHKGALPEATTLKIKLDDSLRAKNLYLYLWNTDTKELEPEANKVKVKGSYAYLTLEHCSTYILTDELLTMPEAGEAVKVNPETGAPDSLIYKLFALWNWVR